MRRLYPTHTVRELQALLNERYGLSLTADQVKGTLQRHKIKSGRTGRLEKGLVPWNKGKKMQPNENSKRTQFKQGNIPQTWRPVGTETVRYDGYTWVKVAEKVWREKHRLVYERLHGPIPKGYVVIFMDQDKQNFSPGNLRLIHRKYLSIVNRSKLLRPSAALTETGLIVAELKHRAAEAKRNAL